MPEEQGWLHGCVASAVEQKVPVLRRVLHSGGNVTAVLKFLIILSLNLCSVSEVSWNKRAGTRGLEPGLTQSQPLWPPWMGSRIHSPAWHLPSHPYPATTAAAALCLWQRPGCQCRRVSDRHMHPLEWGMVAAILAPGWQQHSAPGGQWASAVLRRVSLLPIQVLSASQP